MDEYKITDVGVIEDESGVQIKVDPNFSILLRDALNAFNSISDHKAVAEKITSIIDYKNGSDPTEDILRILSDHYPAHPSSELVKVGKLILREFDIFIHSEQKPIYPEDEVYKVYRLRGPNTKFVLGNDQLAKCLHELEKVITRTTLSSQPDKYREALEEIINSEPNCPDGAECGSCNWIIATARAALKENNHGKNPDLPSFEDVRGIYPKEDK